MEPARVLDFCQEKWLEGKSYYTERFRDVMHQELDKFLDEVMGVFEDQRRPSLAELSDLLTKTRQEFLGSCLQHLIEEKYADELSM
jgi:hypothetical protein